MLAFMGNVGWQETLLLPAVLLPLLGWSLAWRAVAVWKAARRNHLAWFVILSVVATAGILDIIYIFAIAQGRDDGSAMVTATSDAR